MRQLRFLSWRAVSSEEQAERVSLEDQQRDNIKFVEEVPLRYPGYSGIIVCEIVIDNSRHITLLSDAAAQLPQYGQLEELIRGRQIDAIVCRDRTRMGRRASLVMSIEELCYDYDIVLASRSSPPPTMDVRQLRRNEGYRLVAAVEAHSSGQEIRTIQQRNKDGMLGRVKKGLPANTLPQGYRWVFNEFGKSHVGIDTEHSRILRLMLLDLYVGKSLSAAGVAEELNQRGIASPKGVKWTGQVVSNIIRLLDRHSGYVYYNRVTPNREERPFVIAPAKHPAIFSPEEVQAIRTRHAVRTHSANTQYAFAGIVYCEHCDPDHTGATGRLRAGKDKYQSKRHGERVYPRYQCHVTGQHSVSVAQSKLVEALGKILDLVRVTSDLGGLIEAKGIHDSSHLRLQEIEADLESLETERLRLNRAFIKFGAMGEEEYQKQVAALNNRKATLQLEKQRREDEVSESARQERALSNLGAIQDLGLGLVDDVVADPGKARSVLLPVLRLWATTEGVSYFSLGDFGA